VRIEFTLPDELDVQVFKPLWFLISSPILLALHSAYHSPSGLHQNDLAQRPFVPHPPRSPRHPSSSFPVPFPNLYHLAVCIPSRVRLLVISSLWNDCPPCSKADPSHGHSLSMPHFADTLVSSLDSPSEAFLYHPHCSNHHLDHSLIIPLSPSFGTFIIDHVQNTPISTRIIDG
jgi:hypothetical protein